MRSTAKEKLKQNIISLINCRIFSPSVAMIVKKEKKNSTREEKTALPVLY
jgi:hypothetical protein